MGIFDYIFTFSKLHTWFGPSVGVFAAICLSLFVGGGHVGLFQNVKERNVIVIAVCSVIPLLLVFTYMIVGMCKYSFSFDYIETRDGKHDTVEQMVERAVARSDAHSWPQYTTITYVDTSNENAVRVIGYSRYIYNEEAYSKNLYNEDGVVESKVTFKCEY